MARPLDEVKDDAEYDLDMQAEFARRRFTTRGEVMAAVHQEKVQEAIAFVAAGYPTAPNQLKNYPFIKEESDAIGRTPRFVADRILAARATWIQKMAKIEGKRLAAKQDVRNAVSENNVETVVGRVKDDLKNPIP
jgi:hypothetical protein